MSALRLAVTLGDPAGIGPEVVVKALTAARERGKDWECTVVGDPRLVRLAAERLDLPIPSRVHGPEAVHCDPERLYEGRPTPECGRAAAAAVRAAVALVRAGQADALVTAPVNKKALSLAGETFPGHTELLAAELGATRVRMMVQGGRLRVVLVTTHCPLREVAESLTIESVLTTIQVATEGLGAFGAPRPRLALAALNPHAGDGGRFGREEEEVLIPAVKEAVAQGFSVAGPFPADTLFAKAARQQSGIDAVIALYHDQGLIPVKMASFGKATNVTLGLPVVRTSPDHGTAYDIAGQGVADPGSLLEAMEVAAGLAAKRQHA